ncbi:hypothetical protein M407DRAFT_34964 [Tulasnella calospora MUT 4182]|uniref:Uncharacterized protein n=1 Tax=Tulasnella calospora MUT 4182 TaxID=1051891 RepID=A0A0C3Q0H7_9AGAM|nr:hypothetical protein M407DRAFT_34964 [Tulasnella calospora MUT 4182]
MLAGGRNVDTVPPPLTSLSFLDHQAINETGFHDVHDAIYGTRECPRTSSRRRIRETHKVLS